MAANNESKNGDDDDHTYEGALNALLHSPLHQARTKEALAKAAERRTKTIHDMRIYMRRIGLPASSLPAIVHVTGTKGKGSTCCLCESILRRHYGWNTGLFTSPHLVDIRERIRVNGLPIPKTVFGQVYWRVRTLLESNCNQDQDPDLPVLPGYFRMLTLMALFTFAQYQQPTLDVIILEVGMGGRYDATNIIDMTPLERNNIVCGVTLLDLDHTRVLGDTLEKIAWEKGGIFKTIKDEQQSANCNDSKNNKKKLFAIDTNTPGVIAVLEKCAKEEGRQTLLLVGNCTKAVPSDAVIGLPGDHQRINAELAIALCQAVVSSSQQTPTTTIDDDNKRMSVLDALAQARWPGRCQTVEMTKSSSIHLRLDGSHTPISLQAGYDWFTSVTQQQQQPCKRILIFNCSHERNPVDLLQLLLRPSTRGVSCGFERVFFCRSDFARPSAVSKKNARDLLEDHGIPLHEEWLPPNNSSDEEESTKVVTTWQMTLESIWKHLEKSQESQPSETAVNLTVAEGLDRIRSMAESEASASVEVLVAGSLYIVGSALNAIEWSEEEAPGGIAL
ncbi:Folylpolyglutamate synthase [Seminavis robusta]|uniref:tetrahydrofolate synthase n=1 Tax=Seminavis robusta TaxID=568900 RepID=A0A9N8EAN7_9STRA|nr:Folylpolyglutamate synthase [Seminavis robusta]|eukprot:Sro693_g188340.1 Folylpolyglutamate synthase (560) ;mRNA; r:35088-36767